MTDATPRSVAPTCTSTRSPATGPRASRRSSTTSSGGPTSTSSPSPTTSGSMPRVAARAMAIDRGLRAEVVVGEEVTTLGGHLLALYLDRPIRPYRSLRSTILAVHDAGGLAIPAHPLVPYPLCAQGWMLRRLLDDPDPAAHPDGLETFNPTSLGKPWHRRVVRFADQHGLARRRQQRRPRARGDRDRLDDLPRPDGRRPPPRDRDPDDRPRRIVPRDGRPARHVRPAAPQARPRRARRGRRPGPPRRHRPRPRLSRRPPAAAALRGRQPGADDGRAASGR